MSHAETGLYIGEILTFANGGRHLAIHTSTYRHLHIHLLCFANGGEETEMFIYAYYRFSY
jgi:hypothetical protein